MYPSDPKACARQIVKESVDRILAGKFDVPTLDEIGNRLKLEKIRKSLGNLI